MYGTRKASQLFGTYASDSMEAEGGKPILHMAMVFVFESLSIVVGVHGDDVSGFEAPGQGRRGSSVLVPGHHTAHEGLLFGNKSDCAC